MITQKNHSFWYNILFAQVLQTLDKSFSYHSNLIFTSISLLPLISTSIYFQGPWLVAMNWGFIMLVKPRLQKCICSHYTGFYYRGGSRGWVPGVPPPPWDDLWFSNTTGIPQKKKTMLFICVELEQEKSAPPPKKNPGSAPVLYADTKTIL